MRKSRYVLLRLNLIPRLIVLFLLLWLFVGITSAAVTLFGPKEFQRTTGKPDVFQETFVATEGAGRLELFNGGQSSGSRVTSAWVALNGKQVLGPNDFKKGNPFLEVPVMLKAQNSLEIRLASSPGTYVVVRLTQAFPFEEDYSGVIKADLAVTDLVLAPDRCAPQTQVGVEATVTNWGRWESGPASLIFTADGNEIERVAVGGLRAGASASFSINWTAQEPGRHQVSARVEPMAGMNDRYPANDSRLATLRVSGESSPVPELEFGPPQFSPGLPANITMKVYNPSFVDLSDIWLWLIVSGPSPEPQTLRNPAAKSAFDARISQQREEPDFIIAFLAAGESTEVQFAWPYDIEGQYIVELRAGNLPELFPMEERIASWDLVLPSFSSLWTTNQPSWSSLGPYLITNMLDQGPPNTGRIASLAVHPQNPNIIYAASANYGAQISGTGLWKTTDGGQSWKPLGDKFPQMNIMTVALDPINPDIVYCAGGVWRFDTPKPVAPGLPDQITGYIFKSVDGGQNWVPFAHPADGYSKLVVRHLGDGPWVAIYAASNLGVLRYVNNDPYALSSQQSEWPVILDGKIADVVVDPTNPNVVFAVRHTSIPPYWTQLDGLYRTETGLIASGNSDWSLGLGFTVPNPKRQMFVDLFKANPQKVYLLTMDPQTVELRTSENRGDNFNLVYSFPTPDAYSNIKSEGTFLRAHPTIENLVYAGFTPKDLYRISGTPNMIWKGWYKIIIPDVHADQHAMEFFPDSSSFSGWGYVLGNDGGVYRGKYVNLNILGGLIWDTATPINLGLISAEYFDSGFDVSPTNPDVMIGGTQDNGVILYQPFGMWKYVATGDGTAAVIAPSDPKKMYAKNETGQHSSIIRSVDGGETWQGTEHAGVIDGGGPIFTDTLSANTIYVGGAEVQVSLDGGDNWSQIGPDDPQKKGDIIQVLGSSDLYEILYAGTNKYGQVWAQTWSGTFSVVWSLVHEHPDPNAYVACMALAPSNPNVLFVAYGNCTKDKRLRRFQLTPGYGWSGEWITGNLPEIHATTNTKLEINTIAAHPANDQIAFVGTDKGVFQGMFSSYYWTWLPFNNKLPLVRISKLISLPLTGEIRAATAGRGAWSVKPDNPSLK